MPVDPAAVALAVVGVQAGLVAALGRMLRQRSASSPAAVRVALTVRGQTTRRTFLPPDDPRIRPARRRSAERRPVADRLPTRAARVLA